MNRFRLSHIASAVALSLCAGSALAQFSNTVFFGDSLTDSGSYKPVLPPGTGLFTTNPGPVWSQVLAQHFGTTATPADQGGTNYAQGGARVSLLPGYPDSPPTGTATPIATQVAQYLAAGGADHNALYSVWGGANDIFTNLGALQAGAISPADLQTNVATAAAQLVQQVGILQAAGARYIMVWDLPDIGKTPAGTASGNAAGISAITSLYNSTLMAGLDQLGGNVIRLDVTKLLNELIANPAAFGIANVTIPACGTTASLVCTAANLVAPNAATTFLFADGVHPTTAGHMALAQYAESFIEGPIKMAVLAEAPLAVEAANFRAVDVRMQSGLDSPMRGNKIQAWASYDYANPDFNGGWSDASSTQNTISVGADMKATDALLVGLQFGYTENKGDFAGGGGGYKLDETMGTLYAGWGNGPWWLGGELFAGDLDYRDVHRNIQILDENRVETADARGYHYGGRILGGYWFQYASLVHGPYASVAYQQAVVKQFAENGDDSTALSYGQQKRDSLATSVGWQVAGQWGAVRPFARATWEFESKVGARSVSASPVGLGGTYTVGAYKPDNNYALFNLGASTDFGRVTGYISGSATAAKSDGNYWAVTVGLRVPL
ncbi:MAG: autotransporter domain-containing protein [Burkholderiales bacterium]